jgi:hypothetical protein
MVTRTIFRSEAEAEEILQNHRRFFFVSEKDYYKPRDVISFQVVKNGKIVRHRIDNRRYIVTAVLSKEDAPISDKFQLIGFREA